MNKFPEENIETPSRKPLRRENWQRLKEKKMRYSSPGAPIKNICKHQKNKSYLCSEISYEDQCYFHGKFYNDIDKMSQDSFILKYTKAEVPKKKRSTNNERCPKSLTYEYFLRKMNKEVSRVCRELFINTLRLSKNRVQGVMKRHFETGQSPKERRGGDRRTHLWTSKRISIVSFIKKFPVQESHYCRSKTSTRNYLSPDLNVQKMWRLYNDSHDERLQVNRHYFRKIFRTHFNLGFGSPKTDECSTCISVKEQIQNSKSLIEKQNFISHLRVHSLKANAFYTLLKENNEDIFTISFDCQKNLVLPKVSDQIAYYSRQLYKFNFAICIGHSKTKQTKANTFCYHWEESQYQKSSNEICSAVHHCLRYMVTIPSTATKLRVVSDGCAGQNKNSMMIGMLGSWLLHHAPENIKIIEIVYPMVGHSFLPPDRVFARIEKEVRKKTTIVNPVEYEDIISNYATIISLKDKVFDWRSAVHTSLLAPSKWHFKFLPSKRLFLKKNITNTDILIRGEVSYRHKQCMFKNLSKKNKKIKDIQSFLKEIPLGAAIAPAKLKDVKNLLKTHFGNSWENIKDLQYYVNVIRLADSTQFENVAEEDCVMGGINEEAVI